MFFAMTSSTVCALAANEQTAMAANSRNKELEWWMHWRKKDGRISGFISSPKSTVDDTPDGRDRTGGHLFLGRMRQQFVSRRLEELFVNYTSSRIFLSAVRGDVDEYIRNQGHGETDSVIEVVHRSRELLDIHVCRWMNLGHDHYFFGARIH